MPVKISVGFSFILYCFEVEGNVESCVLSERTGRQTSGQPEPQSAWSSSEKLVAVNRKREK